MYRGMEDCRFQGVEPRADSGAELGTVSSPAQLSSDISAVDVQEISGFYHLTVICCKETSHSDTTLTLTLT